MVQLILTYFFTLVIGTTIKAVNDRINVLYLALLWYVLMVVLASLLQPDAILGTVAWHLAIKALIVFIWLLYLFKENETAFAFLIYLLIGTGIIGLIKF